jgi:acetyl esterase
VSEYVLEPAAAEFADAAAHAPPVYELTPSAARTSLEDIQSGPIVKPDVDSGWMTVEADGVEARVRIVKPVGATGLLPVVLYLHGGGWVLGSAATHDRLVRELSVGVHAAVVFVDYDRAPEAPTQSRSSRPTQPRAGSIGMALARISTPPDWRSSATRPAATWPPR